MLANLRRWHRDIKPHNILLALSTDKNEWQFKIADPGCAQFLDATHVKFKKAGSNGKLPVLKDVMVGGRVFGKSVPNPSQNPT